MFVPLALAALLAQTSGNPYLAQAKTMYSNLEFEKCVQRLEMAPQWKDTTKHELEEVEIWAGLCQYQLGNRRDAEERFTLALQINLDAQLPPYTSPKIVDLFKSLQKKVARTHPKEVAVVAPPDKDKDKPIKTTLVPKEVVEPNPLIDARDDDEMRRMAVPIGLGSLAVIAAGTGAYFGAHAKDLERQQKDAFWADEQDSLGRQAQDSATAANVSFGIAIAAATGAAISYFLQPAQPGSARPVVQRPEPKPSKPEPAPKPEKTEPPASAKKAPPADDRLEEPDF